MKTVRRYKEINDAGFLPFIDQSRTFAVLLVKV